MKRIQKSGETKCKKIYFNCRKLIISRKETLDAEVLRRLDTIFWNSPELDNAYELKEIFFRVMDEEDLKLKEKMLSQWISFSKNSNIKEFVYYASTFENWKDEIINSFYSSFTNGCIKGTNNLIKVIKKLLLDIEISITLEQELCILNLRRLRLTITLYIYSYFEKRGTFLFVCHKNSVLIFI